MHCLTIRKPQQALSTCSYTKGQVVKDSLIALRVKVPWWDVSGFVAWRMIRTVTAMFCAALALMGTLGPPTARADSDDHDSLYIGDVSTSDDFSQDTVQRFDAQTGAALGVFVHNPPTGQLCDVPILHGPLGLIFVDHTLLVSNLETNLFTCSGEILQYRRKTGRLLGALVPNTNPDAPVGPRGLVRGHGRTLYVADLHSTASQGQVKQYDLKTGAFLGNLDFTGFSGDSFGEYHPRGLVFGPDGLLYVSLVGNLDPTSPHFD